MEVIEVNRKVLGIAVVLMAVVMLAPQVMAIGPEEAVGKNPNLMQLPYGIGLYPPLLTAEAMNNEWVQENVRGYRQHDLWMDAARYQVGNAFVVPNTPPVVGQVYNIDNQNKWLYLNQDVFAVMLEVWGFPSQIIPFIVAQYPQGIYYKWNLLGAIE
jgi:hypothetical protein